MIVVRPRTNRISHLHILRCLLVVCSVGRRHVLGGVLEQNGLGGRVEWSGYWSRVNGPLSHELSVICIRPAMWSTPHHVSVFLDKSSGEHVQLVKRVHEGELYQGSNMVV